MVLLIHPVMFSYLCSKLLSSQVFLNMLVKVTRQDLPLWHQILVLEILRVSFLGYNSNSCLLMTNIFCYLFVRVFV